MRPVSRGRPKCMASTVVWVRSRNACSASRSRFLELLIRAVRDLRIDLSAGTHIKRKNKSAHDLRWCASPYLAADPVR